MVLAFALALVVALPAAARTHHRVRVPGCGGEDRAAYKPKEIILACGDGSSSIVRIHWSSWSTHSAKGRGVARVDTCDPSCAQGKVHHYRVALALSKPRTCKRFHKREFAHLKVRFTHRRPSGSSRSLTYPRPCSR